LALRAALAMLGLPDFFVSGFLAFCLMISSNFYLNINKKNTCQQKSLQQLAVGLLQLVLLQFKQQEFIQWSF
jgi:hypothetical protein